MPEVEAVRDAPEPGERPSREEHRHLGIADSSADKRNTCRKEERGRPDEPHLRPRVQQQADEKRGECRSGSNVRDRVAATANKCEQDPGKKPVRVQIWSVEAVY